MKSYRSLFVALFVSAMAISLVGCNSSSSSSPTNPIDLSPPQAPTNLHSTTDANIDRTWVVWDPSASANVSSYELYSSSTVNGSGTLVATLSAGTTDYILPVVGEATTDYYRVRAIGTNNVPSAFTSSVSITQGPWDGLPRPGDKTKGTEGNGGF